MSSKKRFFIGLIFTPILILILFLKFDFEGIGNALANVNIWLISLAGLTLLPPFFLSALRWQKNLAILGLKSNFKNIFFTFLANFPTAKISPGNSGDFIRGYLLKDKVPLGQGIGCIFAERIIDVYILALISLFANFFIHNKLAFFLDLSIIAVSIFFLFFSKKIKLHPQGSLREGINYFFNFFEILSKNKKTFLAVVVLTAISWFFVFASIKLTFLALGSNISIIAIMALQPIAIFFGLIPFTISGIGTREPATLLLFSGLAPNVSILLASLIYSFFVAFFLPLLCLPFFILNFKFVFHKKI